MSRLNPAEPCPTESPRFEHHLRRYRVFYQVVFYAVVLLGAYLGMRPAPPPTPITFHMLDAVYHAGGLFVCTILSFLAYPPWRWWLRGGLMFALGVAIECVQSLHPTRTADMSDIYANTAGVAVALLVVMGWQRWVTRR